MGRRRLSDELEAFLEGDDRALKNDELLRHLIGEKFFVFDCPGALEHIRREELTKHEIGRLERLEARYWQWRAEEEHRVYRRAAESGKCVRRYEILLGKGYDPARAFGQAIGPGPNSIVRDIPKDDEQ
jgi:hypothetical protein